MSSTPVMPGSFVLDHDISRYFPITQPHIIPPSPSASSILSQSVRTQPNDPRRRPRAHTHNRSSTPRASGAPLLTESTHTLEAPSPAPLVNTEYVFAGGLPSTLEYKEDYSQYEYEQDLRPNRYSRSSARGSEEGFLPQTPQSQHGSKRRRLSSQQSGWGQTVWNLTGGIAGRAINFCWTVAFTGFHASGGKGYDMDFDTPVVMSENPTEMSRSKDVFDKAYQEEHQTPIPGGFPESRANGSRRSRRSSETIATPTLLTGRDGTTSLKSNWVMVDAPAMRESETSLARKRSRPSTANLYARSTAKPPITRPRLVPRHSASFASPRARASGATATIRSNARRDSSDSDRPQQKRTRSSMASPRRSEGNNTIPVSPDVVKFEKRMQKQSQKQDLSMRRLNQQMQDMIREAQQALGSKIEVTDGNVDQEEFDEGYHEGFSHVAEDDGSWR